MTDTFIKDMRAREPQIGDVYIGNSSKGPDILILLHGAHFRDWKVLTKNGLRQMTPGMLESLIWEENILLHAAFNWRSE